MKALDIIDKVTLPLKYKLVLTIGTAIVLFVPGEWLQSALGLQIRGALRTSLGIVFVLFPALSLAELLANTLGWLSKFLQQRFVYFLDRRRVLAELRHLSDKEQDYLYAFLRDNTITMNLPINDGITQALTEKELIYRSSIVSARFLSFPHNINPAVWSALRDNPELLGDAQKRDKHRTHD